MSVTPTDCLAQIKKLLERQTMGWPRCVVDAYLVRFHHADVPLSEVSLINELHWLIFAIWDQDLTILSETARPVGEAARWIRGTHDQSRTDDQHTSWENVLSGLFAQCLERAI
jgi:hypothetical protein